MDQLPFAHPQVGTWPTTQACALEIELATSWFSGQCSTHWATLARAIQLFLIKELILQLKKCSNGTMAEFSSKITRPRALRWIEWLWFFVFLFYRKRDRNIDVREKHQSVASGMYLNQGLNPQPRHVPWLGIKPTALPSTGGCSNQQSHTGQSGYDSLTETNTITVWTLCLLTQERLWTRDCSILLFGI